jgi:hypothetical protein
LATSSTTPPAVSFPPVAEVARVIRVRRPRRASRLSLTCGGTRWSRIVCALTSAAAAPLHATLRRTELIARGRPALPRCADVESGDKMVDRVLIPRLAFAVAQSLEAVQAGGAGGRLHSGADRKHLRDDGRARGAGLRSNCGGDHLLVGRRVDRRECFVAELAQDVVRASARLARDRQAGAVVIDPPRDLPVVVVG